LGADVILSEEQQQQQQESLPSSLTKTAENWHLFLELMIKRARFEKEQITSKSK
jgi:hypothetical protein